MTTEQLILECSNGALVVLSIIVLAVVLFFLLRMSTRIYGPLSKHGCNNRIHWVQRLDGLNHCKYCGKDLYDKS